MPDGLQKNNQRSQLGSSQATDLASHTLPKCARRRAGAPSEVYSIPGLKRERRLMATPSSWRWRASSSESRGRSCATRPSSSPAALQWRRTGSAGGDHPTSRAWRVCGWWKRDGLTVNRCPNSLCRQMARDAGPFIRTGTRGSPSWPGSNPETGYVDADCSDQSAEAACRRGGPYVDGTLCGLAVDDRRRRARFAACVLPHLNI